MLYEKFMCMLTIGQWKTVIIAYFSTLMTLRRLHVSIQGEAKKENIALMFRSFDSEYMWYLICCFLWRSFFTFSQFQQKLGIPVQNQSRDFYFHSREFEKFYVKLNKDTSSEPSGFLWLVLYLCSPKRKWEGGSANLCLPLALQQKNQKLEVTAWARPPRQLR